MKEIKREIYLERIRPFYDSSYIKLVTGIRRSGKSVILRQIAAELLERGVPGENIHFYDLEGKSGSGIVDKDSLERKLDADLVSPGRHYVFLDEVQRMEGFEEALGYARASYGCSIFATGSNSRLLHGRMQHLLTGRAKEFRVLPFTYRECMEFRSLNGIEILVLDELHRFSKAQQDFFLPLAMGFGFALCFAGLVLYLASSRPKAGDLE